MREQRTYDLLERLAALLRASEWEAAKDHGLQPVHLHALRYLDRCNRYSNTPAAVTAYLGATKGTVSQTLLVLENKGYVEKLPDPKDGRQVRLKVTPAGKRVLADCLPPPILRGLESDVAEASAQALETLLAAFQRASGSETFGLCRTCVHFREKGLGNRHQCGLTLEPLSEGESRLICREHTATSER